MSCRALVIPMKRGGTQPQSCVVLKPTLAVGIVSQKSVVGGKCMVNRFHNVIVHFYEGTPMSFDNATNEAQNLFTSHMFLCHGPSLWKPLHIRGVSGK
jgi:hypothetical protein